MLCPLYGESESPVATTLSELENATFLEDQGDWLLLAGEKVFLLLPEGDFYILTNYARLKGKVADWEAWAKEASGIILALEEERDLLKEMYAGEKRKKYIWAFAGSLIGGGIYAGFDVIRDLGK